MQETQHTIADLYEKMESAKETTEETTTNAPELTEEQKEAVKLLRANPKLAIKLYKRKPYFRDDNHELAILRALNSGVGRRARRNLSRLMCITWESYNEMEFIVAEMNAERLTTGTKLRLIDRKRQLLADKKISKKEYLIFTRIMEENISRDDAEAEYASNN